MDIEFQNFINHQGSHFLYELYLKVSSPLEDTNRLQNNFGFIPTDCNEVKKIIVSFKSKKSCLNEIPFYVFKCIVEIIAPLLASLFNESISNGIFPACLTIARFVPIHKSVS